MVITELKKLINDRTEEVNRLIQERSRNSTFSYNTTEKSEGNIIKPTKTVKEYTREIDSINCELVNLKSILRNANEILCDNGKSINDNIFILKQVTAEYYQMSQFANSEKVTRQVGYDKEVTYKEVNYDIDWVRKEADNLKVIMNKIQLSIDKANISTEVRL